MDKQPDTTSKKRRNRRAHLDDYVITEDGSYVYQGALWSWDPPEARGTFLRRGWLLFGGAVACALGAGFVPAPGVGNVLYVLAPYALALVSLALIGTCLYRLWRGGEELPDHVHKIYAEGLPIRLAFGFGGAGSSAGGELVYAGLNGRLGWQACAFIVLMLGCTVCLLVLYRFASKLRFSSKESAKRD